MPIPRFILIRGPGDLLMRALWLGLAAVHVGPVLRLGEAALAGGMEAGRWIGLVALLLSLGFFGLKMLGAPFLRIHGRWTGVLLFLVACGLLHGNAQPQQWLEKTGYTVLIAGTAAGASEGVRRRAGRGVSKTLDACDAVCEAAWEGVLRVCEMLGLLVMQRRLAALLMWRSRADVIFAVARAERVHTCDVSLRGPPAPACDPARLALELR